MALLANTSDKQCILGDIRSFCFVGLLQATFLIETKNYGFINTFFPKISKIVYALEAVYSTIVFFLVFVCACVCQCVSVFSVNVCLCVCM